VLFVPLSSIISSTQNAVQYNHSVCFNDSCLQRAPRSVPTIKRRRVLTFSANNDNNNRSQKIDGGVDGNRKKSVRSEKDKILNKEVIPKDEEIEEILDEYYGVGEHLRRATECDVTQDQQSCWDTLSAIPLQQDKQQKHKHPSS